MKTYRINILISSLVTALAFILVFQMACKKPVDNTAPVDTACLSVDCGEHGECFNGQCACNTGWEGYFCDIKTVQRYIGAWNAIETVVQSNLPSNVGTEMAYNFFINYDGESVTTFKLSGLMDKQNDTIIVSLGIPVNNYYTPLGFRFRDYASATTPDLYMPGGGGFITSSGSFMDSMSYRRWYGIPGIDTFVVRDTVKVVAQKMQ